MRELRFRAWDIARGQMLYWPNEEYLNIAIDFNGQIVMDSFDDDGEGYRDRTVSYPKGYYLTQYTGLKDKNGTEIYEGDVISGEYDGDHETWEVGWEEDRDICGWSVTPDLCETMEVIGNIYENPELLKEAT